MKTLIISTSFFNFIIFVIGAFTIFGKPKDGTPSRSFTSALILLSMGSLLIWVTKTEIFTLQNIVFGLLLNVSSICLFFYTSSSLRKIQLSPIFSLDKPTKLILDGPYRYIRHPFYTSYILAFCAAAIYTDRILAWSIVFVVYGLYLRASEQEECKFFDSTLKDEYLAYMQRVGRFLPRLF